jgi:hypothetical protein
VGGGKAEATAAALASAVSSGGCGAVSNVLARKYKGCGGGCGAGGQQCAVGFCRPYVMGCGGIAGMSVR